MGTLTSFPISTKSLSEAPEIAALGTEIIDHAGDNAVHVNSQWKASNESRLANIERALNGITFDFEEQSGTGVTVPFVNPRIVQTRPQILGGKSEVVSGSLVNADVSAVESVGFNQWDEEWELGSLDDNTGMPVSSSNQIRSKNYCSVLPNTAYHIYVANNYAGGWLHWYDSNHTWISKVYFSNYNYTSPSNACYFKFRLISSYGTTYKNDICINISSSANGTYKPYALDSLTIPSSLRTDHPLRSAGSVHDEYDFERMVMVQRVGSVDLGSLTYRYYSSNNLFYVAITDGKYTGGNGSGKAVCAKYVFTTKSYDSLSNLDAQFGSAFIGGSACSLVIKDTEYTDAAAFKTAMSGVMLYYELATPVEVDISEYFVGKPVLSAEGGGSVKFAQTQSPALAVPYELENLIYIVH